MREILFRGKRIAKDEFVEGFVFKQFTQPKGEEWYIRAYSDVRRSAAFRKNKLRLLETLERSDDYSLGSTQKVRL